MDKISQIEPCICYVYYRGEQKLTYSKFVIFRLLQLSCLPHRREELQVLHFIAH